MLAPFVWVASGLLDESQRAQSDSDGAWGAVAAREFELLARQAAGLWVLTELGVGEGGVGAPGDDGRVQFPPGLLATPAVEEVSQRVRGPALRLSDEPAGPGDAAGYECGWKLAVHPGASQQLHRPLEPAAFEKTKNENLDRDELAPLRSDLFHQLESRNAVGLGFCDLAPSIVGLTAKGRAGRDAYFEPDLWARRSPSLKTPWASANRSATREAPCS